MCHYVQGTELEKVDQESIMSEDNASTCRQLIFLFHYILGLDQYKMPKQQPLTNNFTAYKRMHSDVSNKQNYKGGGFKAFAKNRGTQRKEHQFTDKELLPISELNDVEYKYTLSLSLWFHKVLLFGVLTVCFLRKIAMETITDFNSF